MWLWVAGVAHASDDATATFEKTVAEMAAAVGRLKSATFEFASDEYVHGAMIHTPETFVKYRPTHDVYMRTGPVDAPSRQVLFRPGYYENKLRVDPGPYLPALAIDPFGRL